MTNRRKVGMTSNPHGLDGLGYTRTTMASTMGGHGASRRESPNDVAVRIAGCNSPA